MSRSECEHCRLPCEFIFCHYCCPHEGDKFYDPVEGESYVEMHCEDCGEYLGEISKAEYYAD